MFVISSIARKFCAVVLAVAMLSLGNQGISPVYAQAGTTWYVTPSGDDSASCAAPVSPCLTINGALGKAAAGDTIEVAGGTYTGSGTEVVLIDKAISLSGGWDTGFTAQSGLSIVDGEAARRVMTTSGDPVIMDHFQIQHGFVGWGICCAGIFNNGVLTLNASIVTGNVTPYGSGGGGGIGNDGTLTINNALIYGNSSVTSGGGIDNSGTLTVNTSTIRDNTVGQPCCGSVFGGAGIQNEFHGNVVLNNTTISNNILVGPVPGAAINNLGPSFALNNSTVSGNSGGYSIYSSGNVNAITNLIINNSTISNNILGIQNQGSQISLQNTILAQNGKGQDCADIGGYGGTFTSQGYNLIGNIADCPLTASTGDQVGSAAHPIDAMLGPLQGNGGPTFTQAPLSGSPAVDTGNPAAPGSGGGACLATDQRGITRPRQSACDIGAYEVDVPFTVPAALLPAGPTIDTTPTYQWNTIIGATAYQYQLTMGGKLIYSKTVPASVCNVLFCTNTPKNVLHLADNYRWRVRAMIGGIWQGYSLNRNFKVTPAKPGFWSNKANELYITPAGNRVDDFAVNIRVRGCGSYKIVHSLVVPIIYSTKQFKFSGAFYGTGNFVSPTSAQGTFGFLHYHLDNCGVYIGGGPFYWTAKWKNFNQPAPVSPAETLLMPALAGGSEPFTVQIESANP